MPSKRRILAARHIPLFDAPIADRTAIAVQWYQDELRMSDISAACGLSGAKIMRAVDDADLPRRKERPITAKSLLPMVSHATEGGSVESLQQDFAICRDSAIYVMQLASKGKGRAANTRKPRIFTPPVPAPILRWRCDRHNPPKLNDTELCSICGRPR